MQLIKRFSDPQKATVYIEKTTNEAAKIFGINSNAVGYVVADDESDTRLCSIFKNLKNKKNMAMAADIFESYGTIRFITIFPLVIKALLTGAVLVVDEFDASIHPMALNSIINVFHNDDINVKHEVDVITCAAPNLRDNPGNPYNQNDGMRKVKISDNELLEIHEKRLRRILDVAAYNDDEVVVLGAFGCGAFQNKPELTYINARVIDR